VTFEIDKDLDESLYKLMLMDKLVRLLFIIRKISDGSSELNKHLCLFRVIGAEPRRLVQAFSKHRHVL
jgi:hypothetical protein